MGKVELPSFLPEENTIETFDFCTEFNVVRVRGYRFSKYFAKIYGPDQQYRFRREFLSYNFYVKTFRSVFYEYDVITDGIYESSVRYFNNDTGKLVFSDKRYIVINKKERNVIPASEMKQEHILNLCRQIYSS